jgi:hypothetical protein
MDEIKACEAILKPAYLQPQLQLLDWEPEMIDSVDIDARESIKQQIKGSRSHSEFDFCDLQNKRGRIKAKHVTGDAVPLGRCRE